MYVIVDANGLDVGQFGEDDKETAETRCDLWNSNNLTPRWARPMSVVHRPPTNEEKNVLDNDARAPRLPARGKMRLSDVETMSDEMIVKVYKREVHLVGKLSMQEREAIGVMCLSDAAPPEVVKAYAEYPRIYRGRTA